MKDRSQIIQDILSRTMTTNEVAAKNGVSVKTVDRIIAKNNIGIGRGKRYAWNYETMTPELAYFIGAYITDGYVRFRYEDKIPQEIVISIISQEFAEHIYKCLDNINCFPRIKLDERIIKNRKGTKPQWRVSTGVSDLVKWVYRVTQNKSILPHEIFQSDNVSKIAFICGVIDGDGSVDRREGNITIKGCDDYLLQFPDLLDELNIKNTGVRFVGKTEANNLDFRSVYFNRLSFIAHNPTLYVIHKQSRLYGQLEKRVRVKQIRKKFPCVDCGEVIISRQGGRCRACYKKTPELLERLRQQAPRANKRANEVRWGFRDKE